MTVEQRAKEIAEFLNIDYTSAFNRLSAGFHHNHHLVTEDFISNGVDQNNPESLLNWYRNTDAYIWELSAYHLDAGFNYSGMCEGIATHLKNTGRKSVLCLGDGIGDLSLRIAEEGIKTTYNDLEGSKTAGYAQYRFSNSGKKIETLYTSSFEPTLGSNAFDAVVALDFFEHVVNVEEWVDAVFKCLKKGGTFLAQNAFGIGDVEHGGSMPMHLSVNNRFEFEWNSTLEAAGFELHVENGWHIKP